MIPLQLTLKNFLSYREATLDFRGLHVACICGANGAGKSSLLEGIIWAIWGQSRAQAEDNVIHLGTTEAIVDFTFQCHQQTYRVIRSRYRGQASTLEFQIQTAHGFRSLTEKGMRATQNLILQHLRLDYDTFINSAYLRQGRADEFMLKRPSERKQILADLLKLDQYDGLAEQAREQARELKAEISLLERNLESIAQQLQQKEPLAIEQAALQEELQQLQHAQQHAQSKLSHLQAIQHQRQTWLHQLQLHQEQHQRLFQDCQRLQRELHTAQQHQRQIESLLQEAETIASHYAQFRRLQADEEVETAKFQAQQAAQAQRQERITQQAEQVNALTDRLHQAQAQLAALHAQEQEIQQILMKTDEIEAGLQQLHAARTRLTQLDQLQMKAAPLVQRRQQVQSQVDRAYARLAARLEELRYLRAQLQAQQQQQPQLQQAIQEITIQIEHLEAQKIYQQKVREKGTERRTFLERLQERQRELERDFSELEHKILMLQKGVGSGVGGEEHGGREEVWQFREAEESYGAHTLTVENQSPLSTVESPHSVAYPPCPLCDRPLDEHHWTVVLEHHRSEQEEIQQQLWVIREQLTTSDREIRILRQEYRALEKELAQYGTALEKRGQLQQQLQNLVGEQRRLQDVLVEINQLERALEQGEFATELQEELQLLDRSLNQLNYDDKNHALARGEVDRWRWSEIKYAEIKQAQRRQEQISAQKPELETTIATLEQQLSAISQSPIQQQIDELNQHIAAIGYRLDHHTAIRRAIHQAQPWQLRYQELLKAQQTYPHVQQQVHELAEVWTDRTTALQTLTVHLDEIQHYLSQTPEQQDQIQSLEQEIHENRLRLDESLAKLGSLQQQQQHLETLHSQHTQLSAQLQTDRRQYRIYQELTQAFGKNGIQALMIENVLPQLEAETNQILGRLSANQLHVQFVTQRAKRSNSNRNADKLIDTLDILISDVQGTRPYETYSGGEAFRVNFAIRLALARLLAQRSGTALQMLIIDEGFGTQDDAGCDRLIGAINAISSDFACILAVTHIPHLKEAFQTRVEIYKTEAGSKLSVLS
jgi:exonuclease SbcC